MLQIVFCLIQDTPIYQRCIFNLGTQTGSSTISESHQDENWPVDSSKIRLRQKINYSKISTKHRKTLVVGAEVRKVKGDWRKKNTM